MHKMLHFSSVLIPGTLQKYSVLVTDDMYSGTDSLMLWRNMRPLSLGQERVCRKCWQTYTRLHSITSQNTKLFCWRNASCLSQHWKQAIYAIYTLL